MLAGDDHFHSFWLIIGYHMFYGHPNQEYDFRFIISIKNWVQKCYLIECKVNKVKKILSETDNVSIPQSIYL